MSTIKKDLKAKNIETIDKAEQLAQNREQWRIL